MGKYLTSTPDIMGGAPVIKGTRIPIKRANATQQTRLSFGAELKMPTQFGTFKQAQRVRQSGAEQAEVGFSTG